MIEITTLKWVPEFVHGFVKDLPVRWALEEMASPYTLRLISREEQQSPAHKSRQPFGQVPVLKDGDIEIFECGSILLHLGEKSDRLLPTDPLAKARARTWVFAALNSIEPYAQLYNNYMVGSSDKQKNAIELMLEKRLESLEEWLGTKEFLEDRFTIGDIMMTTMLRLLMEAEIMKGFPRLISYRERCMARPAFQKALKYHLKTLDDNSPHKN